MDRKWLFETTKKLYSEEHLDKEALKALTDRAIPYCLLYLTKDDYKEITGEDWTPPAK